MSPSHDCDTKSGICYAILTHYKEFAAQTRINETYNDCSVLSHEAICQSCLELVQLHLHRVHSLSDCFTLKSVNRHHKTDFMNTSRGVLLMPKTDVLLSKH